MLLNLQYLNMEDWKFVLGFETFYQKFARYCRALGQADFNWVKDIYY